MRNKSMKALVISAMCFTIPCIVGFGCTGTSEGVGVTDKPMDEGFNLSRTMNADVETDEIGQLDTTATETDSADTGDTLDTGVIDTEKLVYSGSITIDTLKFADAVEDFKKVVSDAGGFVENESVYDDGGTFVYDDFASYNSRAEETRHTYSATVRVPSDKYDSFIASSEEIGDIRSQSSSVDNITQSYSTAESQLEIYETKYERYKELLSKANTVEEMVSLEHELTEIELKVAEYRTMLSVMDTDVAYSTMNVTINEILKRSDIKNKNTFFVRLKETFVESWEGILSFLEGALFFIIRYWWYLALGIIIYKVNKRFKFVKGIHIKIPKLFKKEKDL